MYLVINGILHVPQYGWTPLYRAARYDHSEVAELLIKYGADALDKDEVSTSLHYSISLQ